MKPVTYRHLGDRGRLGNSLFEVAATVGVARSQERPVVFRPDWEYRPFFSLPDEWYSDEPATDVCSLIGGSHYRRTYAQDPNLFRHCADEIRAAFAPSPRATAVLDALPQPGPHDVAVHVRRGDYLAMPDHLPALDSDYYWAAAAVLNLGSHSLTDLAFHVYGDDPEWAAEELPQTWAIHQPATVSDHGEPMDWCDLLMMARYNHHVIANSSYSWFGAWLSDNPSPIAPANWFGSRIDTPSPVLPEWRTL